MLSCALSLPGNSQGLLSPDTRFDNFSVKYNLARQFSFDVITDSSGYMWAMSPGVYRFDGRRVKHYANYNNEYHGLRDNYTEHPVVDYKGRLWIGSAAGLCYYDAVHDQFKYVYPKNSTAAEHAYSACLFGKELFFRTKDGICRLNLETFEIKKTSLKTLSTWFCFADNEGNIIVCTDVEYYVYNPKSDTYKRYAWQKDGRIIRVKDIIFSEDKYWIATNKGLWHTASFHQLPVQVAVTDYLNIQSLALMPATGGSILWLGTGGEGLQVLNCRTEKIIYNFKRDLQNSFSVPSDNIIAMHTDKFGRLWLCTEEGISLLNPHNQFFRQHLLQTGNDKSIYRFIYNIIPHRTEKNIAWINQYGTGLIQFDWEAKKNIRIFPVTMDNENPFYHRNFRAALQLKNGDWALGNNDRLLLWNEKKGIQKIITDFHCPENLPQLIIRNFIEIGDTLYIVTQNGLMKYLKDAASATTVFYHDKTIEYSIGNLNNGFYDEPTRKIWLSSYNGLVCYDPVTQQRQVYQIKHPDTINSNVFLHVSKSQDGNIYCCLRNGIAIFNPKTESFSVITRFGNIISPQCYGMDRINDLYYINSNAGLIQYNPQTKDAALVNSSTPFSLIYSLQPVCRVNNDLVILFNESFAYFNPDEVQLSNNPTPPVLEEIRINNNRVATDATARFSRTENNISFLFTAFDFNNPGNLQFRYRLLSKDSAWVYSQDEQCSASYLGLPPGKYTFEVQSGNKNGPWNHQSCTYSFVVRPAFWQTHWFRILAVLVLTSLIVLLYFFRIRQIKNRQKEKNRMQQLELDKYKQQLELEQISNFFSGSLVAKNNTTDVLNDVAKNLIGKLGFEDCMIYLWNEDKTKLIQQAGHGVKGAVENLTYSDEYNIPAGKGIIGAAVESGRSLIVNDVSADSRYFTADGITRGSEMCVPLADDGEIIGAINIEQSEKNYFTSHHQNIVSTIAAMVVSKLKAINTTQSLYQKELELSHTSRQLAESELAMLRSQMNPHFIFNSLNSVQKYIWENKEEDAAEYLAKFSRLMRAILENSRRDFVTLKEEMEVMKIYTELEHRRSNGRFDYIIKIAEDIDAAHAAIPPMLMQPFIENAIWHGLSKKESKGSLLISVYKESNQLVCIVDDDGVGRQQEKEKKDIRKSMGIEITKQRIERIMHAAGSQAAVRIEDKTDNDKPAGTKVIITLPLQYI